MRTLLLFLVCFMFSPLLKASEADVELRTPSIDVHDKASLQRGAKLYMNYCSGCHSLKYMRYNRMGKDLGLTTFDGDLDKDLLYSNLIFTQAKVHDPIEIAMPKASAREWFGVAPPDLSLETRRRGVRWVYTYLTSFYQDESRPFKANNLLIPGVAMPNVLAPLQGKVIPVRADAHEGAISHLLLVKPGEMTQNHFNSAVEDIVNFLAYVGEPVQLIRYKIGVGVLLFLFLFLISAYKLKKAYWRKLH